MILVMIFNVSLLMVFGKYIKMNMMKNNINIIKYNLAQNIIIVQLLYTAYFKWSHQKLNIFILLFNIKDVLK